MEKIKIQGLIRSAGWMFIFWGTVVVIKGVYDLFWGEPEANLFSPEKWEFVSRHQWLTWSGFEVVYGLACICVSLLIWEASKRFPVYIVRHKEMPNG